MLSRNDFERREKEYLASYAMKSIESRGRNHSEKEHPFRSVYQRDRDRIVHSTAFRRLEYKTQVFVIHEGDYYRTRLTHTLEVSQIARSIARALSLNEDLVESIALAHDIGHPPFGHAGEEALCELMKGQGGFNHNEQGLRVVDVLENKYPSFPGLNLTWEVREGIGKHLTPFDKTGACRELEPHQCPTMEAQVVDIADEIAYDNHDLDDGLTSLLITEEDLKKIELWKEVDSHVTRNCPSLPAALHRGQIIKNLIDIQVTDLIEFTENRIRESGIKDVEDVRTFKERLVAFSPGMQEKRAVLKNFLFKNLYQHYRVIRMADKARRFIKELFQAYLARPEQLAPELTVRIPEEGKWRVVCDYIAGMTDRCALDEYKKLFDPYERV